jgi:outer membrane protein assembly factor BamB
MSPANLAGSRTTRRAQVEFQTGLRLLRVEQNRRSGLGLSQWLITQDGNRLIGRDSMGADLFRYGGGRGRASNRLPGKIDWIQAAQLGDILYATFGGQIVALDSRASGVDRSDRVLWRAYPAGRYPVVPARMPRRGTQNFYHSWSERRRVSNPARMLVGGLGPVSTAGVVLQEQDQLRRVDPLTGETLWSRTDIPPGCELFGDDELLLAADAVASSVHVIRMVDGELVDRHSVPTTSWLLTAGRNVARLTDTRTERGPRKTFRITDTVSDETLFNADYAASVRMATIEPNLIAIVEPPSHLPTAVNLTLAAFLLPLLDNTDEGRFQLVDVATGRLLVDQPLRVTPNLRSIEVLRSGNGLFLMMVGQSRQQPSRYIGLDYPLVNGFVYAFDLATGRPTWPGPAFVEHRGIALTQPEDVPLLMFVDRETTRSSTDQRSQLRLLCLDKRTGATVYRNDALPDTAGGQFSVRAVAGEEPEVQIEMSARTIHLAFSELPRSPEPPANDRVEAARRDSGGGLLGVAERMGQAIQGAIQNPAGTKWNLPASEMNRRRGNRNDGGADDDD